MNYKPKHVNGVANIMNVITKRDWIFIIAIHSFQGRIMEKCASSCRSYERVRKKLIANMHLTFELYYTANYQ